MNFKKYCALLVLLFNFMQPHIHSNLAPEADIDYKSLGLSFKDSLTSTSENALKERFAPLLGHNVEQSTQDISCIFDLFDKNKEALALSPDEHILSSTGLADILCFSSADNFPKEHSFYLSDMTKRTKTASGYAVFNHILAHPTTNIAVIKKRQNIIKAMAQDDNFYEQLTQNLEQFKIQEQALLTLWQTKSRKSDLPLDSKFKKYFYLNFKNKDKSPFNYFASSSKKNNRSTQALNSRLISTAITNAVAPLLIVYSIYDLFSGKKIRRIKNNLLAVELLKSMTLSNAEQTTYAKILNVDLSEVEGTLKQIKAPSLFDNYQQASLLVGEAIISVAQIIMLKDVIEESIINPAKALINAQNLLVQMNGFFDTTKNMLSLLEASPVCLTMPEVQILRDYCNRTDLEITEITELLANATFKEKTKFCSYGRVLNAFKRLYKLQDKLAPLLHAIGTIDAYRSMAQLMRENSTAGKNSPQFCFAEFNERTTDAHRCSFENLWYPLVEQKNAVTNNLAFGKKAHTNAAKHILISGPNAGGKSTGMKATITAALYAQTFGIVAAQSAIFSAPWSKIITSIAVQEDPQNKKSLFKAEAERAQSIIDSIKNLDPSKKILVIMDEVFSGTNAREASALGKSFLSNVSKKYDNVALVISTHFPLIEHMSATDKSFANYHVQIKRNPVTHEFLGYTYKIQPGLSTDTNALDLALQSGFDADIVNQARQQLLSIPQFN